MWPAQMHDMFQGLCEAYAAVACLTESCPDTIKALRADCFKLLAWHKMK